MRVASTPCMGARGEEESYTALRHQSMLESGQIDIFCYRITGACKQKELREEYRLTFSIREREGEMTYERNER